MEMGSPRVERKKKEHDERSHLSYKALDVIVLFTMNIFEVDGNNKVCTSAVIFASKNYSRTKSFYLLNYHSLYEEHTYSAANYSCAAAVVRSKHT